MKSAKQLCVVLITFVGLLTAGCGRLTKDYGRSTGTGNVSLNGFGTLRKAYEKSGFRTRDISRFSDRVMRTDVIVWTPLYQTSVNANMTRWFERWLANGDKTLVLVVPDSGSEADYWIEAGKLAPPSQRLEYRKRAAKSVNQRIEWRLNRRRQQSNGWFTIEPLEHRTGIRKLSGEWESDLADEKTPLSGHLEFEISVYEEDQTKATTPPAGFVGPTGPGQQSWYVTEETTPTTTPIEFSDALKNQDGQTFVAEVRSKRWKNSKIVVVGGGSLLTNYGLSKPMNRKLAAKLIETSRPEESTDLYAGFMHASSVSVSEKKPGVPDASGMELLTVWPMSLVTMHGVMLGLVLCLMLFPIFGRPKKVSKTQHSEFGDHLDAVAALMSRAKGETYARQRISEYMKRMSGETGGPWVIPDKPVSETNKAMPILISRRSEQMRGEEEGESAGAQPETEKPTLVLGELANQLQTRGMETLTQQGKVLVDGFAIFEDLAASNHVSLRTTFQDQVFGATEMRSMLPIKDAANDLELRTAITSFVSDVFPMMQAVAQTRAASASVQVSAYTPQFQRVLKWDVFAGLLLTDQDAGLDLSRQLNETSLLGFVTDALSITAEKVQLHDCNILVTDNGQQRFYECYIDGLRSSAAESELQKKFAKECAVQGPWSLRQFFTMRPSDLTPTEIQAIANQRAAEPNPADLEDNLE